MLSLPNKNFQPSHLLNLFKVQRSSECVLKQEFKLKYVYNYVIFIEKFVKIAQRWGLCPQTPTFALFQYEFFATRLIITAAFT